jgi:hypothetical protein
MPANPLTWALVVATYMSEDVLPRCLRLGAAQIRPPLEIIVVDSSPGWGSTRERAAEIMRVYDADNGRSVVGVNATNVAAPPMRRRGAR